MESTDIYNTDIEMVMDFMKLSLAYDDKNISDKERFDIIKLQKAILELLPVAQSNRMSSVYGMLADIYRRNKKEYTDYTKKPLFMSPVQIQTSIPMPVRQQARQDERQVVQITTRQPFMIPQQSKVPMDLISLQKKKEDHIIVLFYRSTCPACQKIMGDWLEFKRQHKDSAFTVIDYDSENPENKQIFQYFKIEFVPTIFKLMFDAQDKNKITTKMEGEINLANLHRFANF